MSASAWLLIFTMSALIMLVIILRYVLVILRKLETIRLAPTERCASCGQLISTRLMPPVEFTKVPAPLVMGGEVLVNFKVCQRCVTEGTSP